MKEQLYGKAEALVRALISCGGTVATAESCTGGMIAKLITDVPGSSAAFVGGVVSYTNRIKTAILGVDPAIIEEYTEVSLACAKAMAEGARLRLGSDFALSTTGYAGPGGGTEKDPVGTVYIGVSTEKETVAERFAAPVNATRSEVREAAAARAVELLLQALDE